MHPLDLPLAELQAALASGELSAVAVTTAALERAAALNPRLNAFITLDPDGALAAARAVDAVRARGDEPGPLGGVPVAIKDQIVTRGLRTTCASRMLAHYVPPYDAHVVERLRAAGAIVIGKTNLDEFAMGSSNEYSAFGPCLNPWNPAHVPGGSSGGSAVAVAAGITPLALGTDTGGSIRLPAAFCGVTGLKPTWGRVSRYGIVAFASSLDQCGPFGRSVADVAAALLVIAAPDPRDATCTPHAPPDYLGALGVSPAGLRIGIPAEYFDAAGLDPEVGAAVASAIETLRGLGATPVPLSLPHTKACVATYYLIADAEASSNLARYDGVRYGLRVPPAATAAGDDALAAFYAASRGAGFGPEVKRRIMIGTYVLSAGYYDAFYGRAQQVRRLIQHDFADAFGRCDLVLTPTAPGPAPRLGERLADPLSMYLLDLCTISCNLAGLPGLSLPCGFTAAGLPIGLQFIGRPFAETTLLTVGHAYEQATDWHLRRPPEVHP